MKTPDMIKLIFMMVYATGVTIASFWYFFSITFSKVPEDNVQNSNLILGFLIGSAISTFLGYYFGMSQSVRTTKPDDKLPPPETLQSQVNFKDIGKGSGAGQKTC
jgi:hypothetical protein